MACAWHRMASSERYNARSYERIKNMYSELMSGSSNPFFGKQHTPETIERIRQQKIGKSVNKGAHLSPEKRAKISAALTGRKLSEETKLKIGNSCRGKKNPAISKALTGRVVSMESRGKLRQAALMQWQHQKAAIIAGTRTIPTPDEAVAELPVMVWPV